MAEIDTLKQTSIRTNKTTAWVEYVGVEKYEHQIYRLQKEAGLSFKEAHAVLTPPQLIRTLAEEWGCSKENIYNLIRNGMAKVERTTDGDENGIEDLVPTRMCYIM